MSSIQFVHRRLLGMILIVSLASTAFGAQDAATIAAGLESHDRALHIKDGWMRDPYIVLAPDGFYYLTGTTPNPGDPRETADPHNRGLGGGSIVGYHMQLWRSRDLIAWEYLGAPYSLLDGYWAKTRPEAFRGDDRTSWHLWAPEVHFLNGRWHLVHTSPAPVQRGSNLAVMEGDLIQSPFMFPLGDLALGRHDPSLFQDEDGTVYLLWGNTCIVPLDPDLTGFADEPVRIDPSGTRPGPDGNPINRIGHEGATLRRISGKYVHFGTAWSTDRMRKGTYNLYYCTADNIQGPYGPRRFAGRFLGHGTLFQDQQGRWWCTAFFNANVPPISPEEARQSSVGDNAHTINQPGVTIVPLKVQILENGDVELRAKDPAYARPGPEEAQAFGGQRLPTGVDLRPSVAEEVESPRHRLIILADMGNEPDEEQQMAHMLMNCNEFDLEGLIAVTGKFLREDARNEYRRRLHPELFQGLIDGYSLVLPNLKLHADGWPEPDTLRSIVFEGQSRYGIADVGPGKASPGSEAIARSLLKDDPRPIWIVVNAGANTLAQALRDLRERFADSPAILAALVAKLRVFENGAQDNAGAGICSEFPEIHWIRSNYQTYAYGGPGGRDGNTARGLGPHFWKPYPYSVEGQHQWLNEHVQTDHGALGERYPDRRFGGGRLGFMEGGGTVPWLGLVNKGLFDIDQPSWGGWSGRFTTHKVTNVWSRHRDIKPDEERVAPFRVYREASDVWTDPESGETFHGDYVPVWRWRPAMYANLICRMDWCIKPVHEANHHPTAAFNSDCSDAIVRLKALAGETLSVDASASTDPDGDPLLFSWWQYPEAGTYPGGMFIEHPDAAATQVHIPTGAAGHQIHLILEVRDDNPIASLRDYRRVVIEVADAVIELEPTQR